MRTLVKACGDRMLEAVTSLTPERKYQSKDAQQPNVLLVNGLTAKAFWSEEEFVTDITVLESQVKDIVKEFENVYNKVWPEGWYLNNTPEGEWAVYHLINQGAKVQANADKCPKTYEILENLAGSMSTSKNLFANASFSVVQSGTHISPHYGPTNVRIRCHLGLRVSDPVTSYITVNGEKASWQAGKCLIFDDSFLHEVHHSDVKGKARAVLLIDMWHPNLTLSERDLIDEIFKFKKCELITVPPIPIPISPLG